MILGAGMCDKSSLAPKQTVTGSALVGSSPRFGVWGLGFGGWDRHDLDMNGLRLGFRGWDRHDLDMNSLRLGRSWSVSESFDSDGFCFDWIESKI